MSFPQGNLASEELTPIFCKEPVVNFVSHSTKYALVACYLDQRKRVDMILRSWKFVPEELSLIVVGDGPNFKELKSLSTQMGLSQRVFFTGRISDGCLTYLISNALFGVVASQREGFPTFIVECLKSGIPAIFFISNDDYIYERAGGDYLYVRKLNCHSLREISLLRN